MAEGDPGTWSHCGKRAPHSPHLHSFSMNEGLYRDILCNGTPEPAPMQRGPTEPYVLPPDWEPGKEPPVSIDHRNVFKTEKEYRQWLVIALRAQATYVPNTRMSDIMLETANYIEKGY